MAVFGEKRGVKLNIWFCNPQKARPCAERILRQNPCLCLGCRRFEEPPKKRKNSRVNNLTREIAHAQKRNPLSDLDEILHDGRYPRRNHVVNVW